MSRRPNFFIIGAPKSGTTSLYEYLVGHPQVFMSAVKEPMYFSPDVQGGPRKRFDYPADEDQYVALFSEAGDEKWLGEASTRYLVSREAAHNICDFAPDARYVAMLRNPVDFVYAMHNERVSQGMEDVADFETALALDDARRAGRDLPVGSNPLGAVYRDQGLFGEQIQRWFGTVGRDRVHVIVFDDFVTDTPAEFRKVLDFLEIDPEYAPGSFAARNRSYRRRGGVARKLTGSAPARFLSRGLLPSALGEARARRITRQVRHSRLSRKANPRPPMRPELIAELEHFFAPDVKLLGSLLDRDLAAEWFGADQA